ncbi:malto-oligosyltrehalose trehalohydrolase [Leptolyngbya sp. 'hensonii']|uniref:malto-oligosyltrehalose trehalohydrolase n=1 Tax=Leptolyngbya sp. 'hensonii' TaxID=1922337 RepID=UPI00094F5947|nr:malto-oligosyltrehalose trehalohydrolase [Leptolyngbya sp. 'hensonii']OLP16761.1 malto-oligosyltrehalose trehalohydrolase [Leptolyngbya sp. 'hensonii']
MKVGAQYLGEGRCAFTVWAPALEQVEVQILAPREAVIPLERRSEGYWQGIVADLYPGALYRYRLNRDGSHPDPASQFQPQGVHGPSQVVDPRFDWTDESWRGIPLEAMVLYELHVGTFTPEGTFAAIIPRLPELRELGVTAIELMPIGQFPGDQQTDPGLAYRNWGYDGVYPFAVQNSYGGPDGLKCLVNACHQQGIAVVLDVVYNHFGPEGNYTSCFGPYFTENYRTPWGRAINFDGADSPGVRRYVIQNVLFWFQDYHLDALRLDATHAIYDLGARHVLQELAEATAALGRDTQWQRYLIAESDLNDPRLIRPWELGGYGLDAQWNDDFHHGLHTLLTGERLGYYMDFGQMAHLAKAYEANFVYDWQYSPHRQRYHGMPCLDRSPSQFVVYLQNHDQVGNRMLGDRITQSLSFEATKLAAGAMLLSPGIPMLFMGEEYGEPAPFTYFVSHADPDLIRAVRQGRKQEFEPFHLQGEPPDPEAVETFTRCRLNWHLQREGRHKVLWEFYQMLLTFRRTHPVMRQRDRQSLQVTIEEEKRLLSLIRLGQDSSLLCLLNFNPAPVMLQAPTGRSARKLIDSADERWMGPGSQLPIDLPAQELITLPPESLMVYELIGPFPPSLMI